MRLLITEQNGELNLLVKFNHCHEEYLITQHTEVKPLMERLFFNAFTEDMQNYKIWKKKSAMHTPTFLSKLNN